jgi:hypothetical protein
VTVSKGWAYVDGCSVWPSSAGDLLERPYGFYADGPVVRGSLTDLVEALRGLPSKSGWLL